MENKDKASNYKKNVGDFFDNNEIARILINQTINIVFILDENRDISYSMFDDKTKLREVNDFEEFSSMTSCKFEYRDKEIKDIIQDLNISGKMNIEVDVEYQNEKNRYTFFLYKTENEGQTYTVMLGTCVENSGINSQDLNNRDRITGLCNQYYIEKEMDTYTSKFPDKSSVGYIIDIDDFRMFNEIYGREVGDKYLYDLGDALLSNSPKEAIVSRLYSDVYFVFLPMDYSESEALALGKKYVSAMKNVQVQGLSFNSSIGIVMCEELNSKEIMLCANIAMKKTKQNNKGRYSLYNAELNIEINNGYSLVAEVDRAVAENEFEIYYQPVINAKTNEIDSLEALIRWNHPIRNFLTPNRFIEEAESSGKIIEIGNWVIEDVAKTLFSWQNTEFRDVSISVNIAVIQLQQINFADVVKSIIQKYNVSVELIDFEIIERAMVKKSGIVASNINKLRDLGFNISLDDFGTEYSSLSTLNDIAFDTIKVDRFFTQSINSNFVSQSVIEMIYKLVKKFNKKCVVEGVETKEQLEMILGMGFTFIQGYYFSKPVSKDEIVDYMLNLKGRANKRKIEKAILYVENEPHMRNAIARQLGNLFSKEFFIESAESAADALDLVDELIDSDIDISVAIVDYNLKDVKCMDFLKKLEAKSETTKSIILTGSVEKVDISKEIKNTNVKTILTKPLESRELYEAITSL